MVGGALNNAAVKWRQEETKHQLRQALFSGPLGCSTKALSGK